MGAKQKQIKRIIRREKKKLVAEYILAGEARDFRCIHSRQMVKKGKKIQQPTSHPVISSLT